jgi:Gly-Xaa carboxypeptidase
VLAFGQDEEISGHYGAASIGKHLISRYGEHSMAMIVDEGGMGLDTVYGRDFAFPGVAEKGYLASIFNCMIADLSIHEKVIECHHHCSDGWWTVSSLIPS